MRSNDVKRAPSHRCELELDPTADTVSNCQRADRRQRSDQLAKTRERRAGLQLSTTVGWGGSVQSAVFLFWLLELMTDKNSDTFLTKTGVSFSSKSVIAFLGGGTFLFLLTGFFVIRVK